MEQECLKSVSERRQRDIWCTKFSRKTVPHSRSLDGEAAIAVVCSRAWNSQSAGVSGSMTPAGDCWRRLAMLLKVLWNHAAQTLVDQNFELDVHRPCIHVCQVSCLHLQRLQRLYRDNEILLTQQYNQPNIQIPPKMLATTPVVVDSSHSTLLDTNDHFLLAYTQTQRQAFALKTIPDGAIAAGNFFFVFCVL